MMHDAGIAKDEYGWEIWSQFANGLWNSRKEHQEMEAEMRKKEERQREREKQEERMPQALRGLGFTPYVGGYWDS